MKAHRKEVPPGDSFVFNHQRPKNVLRLQQDQQGLLITAARDNFSARDKAFFIRHLVAEGFIDNGSHFSQFAGGETNLRWEITSPASKWLGPQRRTKAFMTRLLVSALLLWVLEMSVLFLTRS